VATAAESALGLLGLAQRAGKLFIGAGPVLRALSQEKPGMVFLATDAGEDVRRKIERARGDSIVVSDVFAGEQLAALVSRQKVSVVSVHDVHFVKGLRQALAD
jgi:ribosomal protein L7Ae-like RNA K-turn-binding protein